ncbi:terminase family protein [Neomegalonema sp.]|uniref:terminase large subunit domain-containing protein n=1 Tax=Neomegalonema sp. TaxID=2039713 RepID=UPI002614A07E|nr:terminase family protein [Neomegalonema sp.]MDD2870096.1 terminase family protein [Neomegalonema sp.]
MRGPAVPLLPYQQAWLRDRARFKVGMWSRQIGKTFTTTLEAVDDCFEAFVRGERRRWVILSRGERQAKEAMDAGVKLHAKAYQMAFEELEYEVSGAGETRYKALEVVLPGGSRITALPANPDTARGFSANVLLDEFAFHHDSRAIWKALFPVISAGHKIRVVSTPNGKGNKFYELMTSGDSTWSRHVVDIHQAVAEGLPRDVEELRSGIADEEAWDQEYELKWLDEASAWLPYDLIMAAEDLEAGDPDGFAGGPCFIGNDIARRNDLWVSWVWEQVGDVFWAREILALKGASFSEQEDRLHDLMRRYNPVRLVMDQTGMGEKPVEDAQRRYGELRVEGVLMTAARQLDLATHAKQIFEDRKARIPAGDPVLRADLHKIRKIIGPSGRPRLMANRDSAGHADRTWAAFMGLAGAAQGAIDYGYRPVDRSRMDEDRSERAGRARFGRGAW